MSIHGQVNGGAGVESKWECIATIKDAHQRSIYSVDWSEQNKFCPESLQGRSGEGQEYKGLIASTGGDGSIHIWEIIVSVRHARSCLC